MITYVILLILIAAILVTAYRKFDRDILSPTVVSCAAFFVSILLALIGLLSWNDQAELLPTTAVICVVGLLSFFIGEFLARRIIRKKNNGEKDKEETLKIIQLHSIVYLSLALFIIVTTIILVLEIKKVCAAFGFEGGSMPELLAFYRSKTSLFSNELLSNGIDISFIPKQMKKIVDCLFIVLGFIGVNNYLSNKNNKKAYLIPLILAILCVPSSFLANGGRSMFMHMIISILIIVLLMIRWTRRQKNSVANNKKIIIAASVAAIVSGLSFYALSPIVGRKTNSDLVTYISFYYGTPVASMNKKIASGDIGDNEIGGKTFYGVYSTLNRYGIIDYKKPSSDDWVTHNSYHSNVYTSFWSYYSDFGIIGVIVCQTVFGFCVSYIYVSMNNSRRPKYLIFVYAYYSYVLIDQVRGEHFYSLLSSTTLVYLVIFYLIYTLLIKENKKCPLLKKK